MTKSRYLSILPLLLLIASFILPAKLAAPAPVSAELTAKMEWVMVDTPDSEPGLVKAVFSPAGANGMPRGSEIIKLVVGNNGTTMYALARIGGNFGFPPSPFGNTIMLLKSNDGGVSWVMSSHGAIQRDSGIAPSLLCVWDIALAPDNPRIVFVAISNNVVVGPAPGVGIRQQVWASEDGGANWNNTQWPPAGVIAGTDIISTMDVTADINGYRKVLVGTRNGVAATANSLCVMKMPGFGGWNIQSNLGSPSSPVWFTGDVIAAKFSPTFVSDSTIVVMMSNAVGTYTFTGVHDIAQNFTVWQGISQYVEVKNATSPANLGYSPGVANIISGMIQLPSDYSGQSASLRRIYSSTDAAPYLAVSSIVINNSLIPGAPVINNFMANPSLIAPGQNSTLSWNIALATAASIDQGIGPVLFPVGTQVVKPSTPLSYTLTATNILGSSTAVVTFTWAGDVNLAVSSSVITNSVLPGAPVINNFMANPSLIAPGQNSTLSWNIALATAASIDQGIGPVLFPVVTQVVTPATTITYTLTATNIIASSTAAVTFTLIRRPNQGVYRIDDTIVSTLMDNTSTWAAAGSIVSSSQINNSPLPGAPVINNINAIPRIPSTIAPGQLTTLSWNIAGATAASIDQGIGPVAFPIGAQAVFPPGPITYTLTATNISGSSTATITFSYIPTRRAHSIALFGTYATAKLLVGETLGRSCQATVPVWFTDSPMSTVSCWYPAKKPPTGAAGDIACSQNSQYYGNAYVAWSPTFGDRGVAYCVTGASNMDAGFKLPLDWWLAEGAAIPGWPSGLLNYRSFDESAFSLSRNNGETWNQLSLIDTNVVKLTDVAPSADGKTVYLASANNGTLCKGFDSVWRSSESQAVVSPPLPSLPIGQIWERVRTSPTALTCNATQSNYAILRLAPDKTNGQIVFWAAGGGFGLSDCVAAGWNPYQTVALGPSTRAAAWSPDFGDYWSDLNPRNAVQDMAAESSTVLYVLGANPGTVQKMPYVGTAWSNSVQTVSTNIGGGHSIDAQADGKVIVGNQAGASTPFPAAVSTNGSTSFIAATRTLQEGITNVGIHAIMDTDYKTNGTAYLANDVSQMGRIWRNKLPSGSNIDWEDMVSGFTTHLSYFGIVETNSRNVSGQGTLYAAHSANAPATWSGVERNLLPLSGNPKPGQVWDCMDASAAYYQTFSPCFTLEPESLKLSGCLTQDTNTTLWAIDNKWYAGNHTSFSGQGHGGIAYPVRSTGMLWAYVDCMAKKGPKLTMDDGTIIGCDPASGRAQEVNFTWEQLCIANGYELNIGKDKGFSQMVYQVSPILFAPPQLMSPALVYTTGGGTVGWFAPAACGGAAAWQTVINAPALECGHMYYWRIRVRDETTCDAVRSPWSDVRSFTFKAGFRVTTPYYGPQLLAPDNGCGCPCGAPICFSWSPFKETQEYKFELSTNADMSSPLVSTAVKTTAYQYTGTAKCNTNYFWRVQAIKPAPSEWSAVFSFQTQKEAPPPPPPSPPPGTPMWVWVIIAIGAILVIVVLVLIFRTRRV